MSPLTSALLLLLLLVAPAEAQDVRVLSPTPADCVDLTERLARNPRARQDPSRSLGAEGQRLCQGGQVRAGVALLRRALRAAQEQPHTGGGNGNGRGAMAH